MKVNFLGTHSTAKTLRKIAGYFEDEALMQRVEEVIATELASVQDVRRQVKARCQGKLSMLFVGGSRAHHYQELFAEIGMRTIAAGYEFAHRDDYEGREVLPDIKLDADSRNIEELEVEPDPEKYRPRKDASERERLEQRGVEFSGYEGMMQEMEPETLVIDDISQWETEKMIEHYKPDIFCAGIKEKYTIQKRGVPSLQLHSYDYGGPFAVFQGAATFWRTVDRMVNSPVWGLVPPPWKKPAAAPSITAELAVP
jgi:nitrogenase molybdenum-iron protein alpha chain